jgi:ketosteroid isomerase-like protein
MANMGNEDLMMRLKYRETPDDVKGAERNRQAVMDALDKVAAGDFDPFWALFDDNVVFHEASCLPYGGEFKGKSAAIAAYTRLSTFYSQMRTVIDNVLTGGDHVIIYQTVNFTVKANGNTGSFPAAEMLYFQNGKVVEWRALYFDANYVMKKLTNA